MKETVTNQIEEFLQKHPDNFQIVEEQIDIDLQFEYFNVSKQEKKDADQKDTLNESTKLFDGKTSTEECKKILVQLAALDKVEALRIIEKYYKQAEGELRAWAYLAKKESKLIIESNLLDEKQILISTGLGGKGNKLRYFIVLVAKDGQAFSDTQERIIQNEFDFILKKNNSSIEDIVFESKYSKITALIPLNISIKKTLQSAVSECNNFGGFLESNFLVTNVKILTLEEIEQFLNDSKKENTFAD